METKFNFNSAEILKALSQKERDCILSRAQLLSFKKGQLIFYEKGTPTGIFILKKGKAKIYKTGVYGKEQIFYIYKEGDLFGYHALLCHEKYADSCEAIEATEVLFINNLDVEYLLDKIPKLKTLFIQNMGHEFGILVNIITILAQAVLRERVALFLLVLHERYYDNNTKESKITLCREDFANIVGTTRESLSRLLHEFKSDKIISIKGKSIQIENYTQLQALAY